ncbi:hypothetical protein [Sphingomonas sp.]|jgi:hypothetical protein|uniref:hypothetical protein n=1 Tax=Sphingomonas sp. TaxID=28214 RepID=UPI003567615A
MAIEWIDRSVKLPKVGVEVLAFGKVPTIDGMADKFIGCDHLKVSGDFGYDGTGHCGMVRVTHWAEINGPIKGE